MIEHYQTMARRGVILAITLWVLSILSIFGLYLGYGAKQKIIFLKRMSERSSLGLIAEAGIKKAILELSRDDSVSVDSFREEYLNGESLFKDVKLGLGKFNVSYKYRQEGNVKEIFGIIDEARKVNINKADLSIIKRLFRIVFDISDLEAQEFAASIVDFRDKDSALSIPLGSAEDSYYTNLSEPYNCKDDDFEVIDELLLVKGITQKIFDKIKDFVTVYGGGAVNINTASYEVLYAIGIERRVIDYIIAYRRGEDNVEGTVDDNIFSSPQSIVAQLSQHYSLSLSEMANLSNLVSRGYLVTGSEYFTIKSHAQLNYSSAGKDIVCVVNRKGKILYWRES
jgi:general secretion pathway protein K